MMFYLQDITSVSSVWSIVVSHVKNITY